MKITKAAALAGVALFASVAANAQNADGLYLSGKAGVFLHGNDSVINLFGAMPRFSAGLGFVVNGFDLAGNIHLTGKKVPSDVEPPEDYESDIFGPPSISYRQFGIDAVARRIVQISRNVDLKFGGGLSYSGTTYSATGVDPYNVKEWGLVLEGGVNVHLGVKTRASLEATLYASKAQSDVGTSDGGGVAITASIDYFTKR